MSAELERRGRRPRRRKRLLALLVGYALAELLALPALAVLAPLRVRAWLPAPMYVLGERSKSHVVPRDWVLVLGDSYAEGQGDWLTAALREGGNPPFQATDVLHELTGRDVVTFGSGGADNVSSTAFLCQKRLAALRRLGLADPAHVFVYFYEGNDPADNLRQAQRRLGLGERTPDSYTREELDAFVERRARTGTWKGTLGTFFGPYTLVNAISGGTSGGKDNEGAAQIDPLPPGDDPGRRPNVFRSGGELFCYEGLAQGPPVELSEVELAFTDRVMASCLAWVVRRFEDATTTLVYLPSPLACYELVSDRIEVFTFERRPTVFSAEAARATSDGLRRRMAALAREAGVGFLDATPVLRSRGAQQLVHGPGDGKHLNRAGYEALARALAGALPPGGA